MGFPVIRTYRESKCQSLWNFPTILPPLVLLPSISPRRLAQKWTVGKFQRLPIRYIQFLLCCQVVNQPLVIAPLNNYAHKEMKRLLTQVMETSTIFLVMIGGGTMFIESNPLISVLISALN